MRFSHEQAVALGVISQAEANRMLEDGAKSKAAFLKRIAPAAKPKPQTKAAKVLQSANDPQTILYDALVKRLPDGVVEWEVENLIEGRKYRVDILVGGRLIVEMDGFAYHRSKAAFQSDRVRQNLFAAKGYFVFRTFAKEVFDGDSRAELVELIAGAYFKHQNGSK